MQSLYLYDVDFHTPTEAERKEIRIFQNQHIRKCWLKRFLITFAIIGTIITFQLIARQTIPNMFGEHDTIERLLIYGISAFVGINILSFLQLLFKTRVIFNMKKANVSKLTVKKKIVVDEIVKYINIRVKYKYLVCELPDGTFIMDRVWVRGPIAFSCIKEGQTIYVERIHDVGHYQYYYVA
ncbi:MAG: hypothetical protein HFG29_03245 [Eubacterium sp.]|nr:hypothetical protein [Eubacterium sp.]